MFKLNMKKTVSLVLIQYIDIGFSSVNSIYK